VNWALALAVFFSDPSWTTQQLTNCYNWATGNDLRFKPQLTPVTCTAYESFAWQMMDSVEQYWEHSRDHGIGALKFVRDIQPALDGKKLVELKPTNGYVLDTMKYSFPFAIPETKVFIDTLASRFQAKLVNTDLAGMRLVITSVLRTESSVKQLMRFNRNAIRRSAHLHGTTFDVSYASYDFKRPVSAAEADYLREVLALALFELRAERKCWVTYELYQTCFHVVTREGIQA
jgi:hypothetical protein